MNVNEKGCVGFAMTMADLVSRGYSVFIPIDGSCPVDLIAADKNMNLIRLQIKYRSLSDSKTLEVPMSSVVNGKRIPMDVSKIDGWAVYYPVTNKVYYVAKW